MFGINVLRAGTRQDQSSFRDPLHSKEVDVLVPPDRPLDLPLAFGKRRGVKNDEIIDAVISPQKFKDIPLDEPMVFQGYVIKDQVLLA